MCELRMKNKSQRSGEKDSPELEWYSAGRVDMNSNSGELTPI